MTRRALPRLGTRALPLAFAMTLGAASPLLAQGTKAEREACTADAIQFCSDTIPDVDRTTVCMKQHLSELSSKCRPFVADRNDGAPPPESHADRGPSDDNTGSIQRSPDEDTAGMNDDDDDHGIHQTRRTIARLCADGLIDPGTCRRTDQALRDAE